MACQSRKVFDLLSPSLNRYLIGGQASAEVLNGEALAGEDAMTSSGRSEASHV